MLDFTRALRAPFEDEQPEIVAASELASRWGTATGRTRRCSSGPRSSACCAPSATARCEVLSPRLIAAGAELAELGVSADAALDVAAKMRRSSEAVARAFVDLFLKNVWEPFDQAGRPEEDWPKVREALERLRPLASDALLAMFQIVMSEATEGALERALQGKLRDGLPLEATPPLE